MITRRTKIQLAIFCLITLLGVSFVGAKYARLDSLFFPDHFTVVAHFADSGGIYQGGEVTYRGVTVGQVGEMVLTPSGVDVHLDIDRGWDHRIPSNTLAVVGDRSAVGEQYVELQPSTDSGPYLDNGSQIAEKDTSIPIPTQQLLADTATTVNSVNRQALSTSIDELGKAFQGTGPALQQILQTSSSFLRTANKNFATTTSLIKDGNTVLRTQADESSAIKSFAKNLSLFSATLAGDTPDLIRLIENGSAGAVQLRSFLQQNDVDLSQLLNYTLTTGQIINAHLAGLRQILVVYPYVTEGGFTVEAKEPGTNFYNAHFGLVLTNTPVCHAGYTTTRRDPFTLSPTNFNKHARCTEPASESDPRGAQNAPRAVASYNPDSKKVTWKSSNWDTGASARGANATGSEPAPATLADDSWKWLYLEPLTVGR